MLRPALVLLLLCGPACAAGTIGGPATVIDGDTIEVNGARLHLAGIDAPEIGQNCGTASGSTYRCGQAAARALRARIGTAAVTCERSAGEPKVVAGRIAADKIVADKAADRVDPEGLAATCHVAGEDLAAWMVAQGHALASRIASPYVRQEGQAWATRRGLWAGTFEKPADWRLGHRRMEAAAGAN